MDSLLLLILLMLVLVLPTFMMQRRQRRKVQELRTMQDALALGEHVITTAGIHARVTRITETTVDLEISPGVECTFEKFAVLQNLTQEAKASTENRDEETAAKPEDAEQ